MGQLGSVMANPEVRVPFDESSNNGLVLVNNKHIPEDVMLDLFVHYIDHKTLLSCQLVCKRWHTLFRNYIWRRKAEVTISHPLPVDKNAPWTMYYLICSKKPFNRNLIQCNSGLSDWKLSHNDGDGWIYESSAEGVTPLPEDPLFRDRNDCFAGSFNYCWKSQTVDLLKEGCSEYLLDHVQPVIKVTEYYSARWDCAARYENKIKFLDKSDKKIKSKQFSVDLRGETQNQWFKYEYEFKNYGPGLRKIYLGHGGKDLQFWAGHYGPKIARSCIILEIPEFSTSSEPEDTEDVE